MYAIVCISTRSLPFCYRLCRMGIILSQALMVCLSAPTEFLKAEHSDNANWHVTLQTVLGSPAALSCRIFDFFFYCTFV